MCSLLEWKCAQYLLANVFFLSPILLCLSLHRPCKRRDARQMSCRWLTVPWWARRICSQDSEWSVSSYLSSCSSIQAHTRQSLQGFSRPSKHPSIHQPKHLSSIQKVTVNNLMWGCTTCIVRSSFNIFVKGAPYRPRSEELVNTRDGFSPCRLKCHNHTHYRHTHYRHTQHES